MDPLEIFGAIWLTFAIFMVGRGKSPRWWLFYAGANIPFTIVQLSSAPPKYGYTIMGLICCLTALWNYVIAKKKKSEEIENAKIQVEKEIMSHLR